MKIAAQLLFASTSLAIGLLSASSAQALEFTEAASTDVGELLGDAADAGTADLIRGAIDTRTVNGVEVRDVDLFKIFIPTTGQSTFDANPADTGPRLNINLFLFNEMGNPLFSREPVELDSMTIDFFTPAGVYFLGIASDDLDAFDAMNNLIAGNDSPDTGVVNGAGVLARWSPGNETTGKYSIKISTIPTAVPTPALLPGLIGMGLSLMRRQRQKNAESNRAIEV
jgi:hypothetical protein